jgi:S-formylglutathione hydrolase FrmB
MHFLLLAALLLHIPASSDTQTGATSQRLREELVQSAALGREMKYRVLLPADYGTSQRRYPVLYLLHGLGGTYKDWSTRTNLAEYTRTLPLIIVMPDGENSWYTNAENAPAERYEDYILVDLQADVAGKYRTINSRHGRTIAGLSMGGYGALKMALRRPAAFTVVGSFSGAFSATRPELLKLIPSEEERLRRIYGDDDSAVRRQNDLPTLAGAAKPGSVPYIYIDCGIADGLVETNREVVAALHKSGVAYEYHEVAGAHNWEYWDRRIREFLPILMKKLSD